MRVTTAFKRLLDLPGVTVTKVSFEELRVVVTVQLGRRHLACPKCDFTTRSRYDTRQARLPKMRDTRQAQKWTLSWANGRAATGWSCYYARR